MLGAAALAATALAGCSGSDGAVPSQASSALPGSIPLADSSADTAGTWATVPMGHLNDPLNTFWQLFSLAPGSSHWALATPPGVASNGGLVAALGGSGSLTAGFGPSINLRFSPLARTTDQGANWTAGVLPGPLALVPDALAASSDARSLALLGHHGGEVVASGGDLSSWRTIATSGSLAASTASSGCGIQALTAVAFQSNGDEVVGAACGHGDRAGVFVRRGGSWLSTGPLVPAPAKGPIQVIRLLGTANGATTLISAGADRSRQLFAAWSTDGMATWSLSAPLHENGGSLTSTGSTTAGGLIAVTKAPDGTRSAAVIDAPGTAWRALAPLPTGTVVVAPNRSGTFDALVVDQSTLQVDALGAAGWHHLGTVDVPIQYGSSG